MEWHYMCEELPHGHVLKGACIELTGLRLLAMIKCMYLSAARRNKS